MKNPFDGGFKTLAEDHPELLLRLLGIVAPGKNSHVVTVVRELRLDAVQIDHAYFVDNSSIAHFEAITRWDARRVGRLALYRFLLRQKYRIPVISHVVLLAQKHAPRYLPELLEFEDEDGLQIRTPYHAIRLWEIDPDLAFEPEGQALLPWVPLLRGGDLEFERAADAIEYLVDNPNPHYDPQVLASDLATLAALRYDKEAIRRFLQRLLRKNMISIDAFKVTWMYQEGVEEGEAKGKAEGKAEGLLDGKRAALRLALASRFPQEQFPEIDQVHQSEALDSILLVALEARTPDQVRTAILTVVRPH